LFFTGTSVGNGADLTEDTLQTYTLPTGMLANAGDTIKITAGGAFGATTDSKTAAVHFGGIGSAILSGPVGVTAAQARWATEVSVTKTGASTQSYAAVGLTLNSTAGGPNSGTLTATDTGTIQILVTGKNVTNSVAGSVTCQYLLVEFVPGS
jgi:hypothetical protein